MDNDNKFSKVPKETEGNSYDGVPFDNGGLTGDFRSDEAAFERFASKHSPVKREPATPRTAEFESGSTATPAVKLALDRNTELANMLLNPELLAELKKIADSNNSIPQSIPAVYDERIAQYEFLLKNSNRVEYYQEQLDEAKTKRVKAEAYGELFPSSLSTAVFLLQTGASKIVSNSNSVKQAIRSTPDTVQQADLSDLQRALQSFSSAELQKAIDNTNAKIEAKQFDVLSKKELESLATTLGNVKEMFGLARKIVSAIDMAATIASTQLAIGKGKIDAGAITTMREDIRVLTTELKKSSLPGVSLAALNSKSGGSTPG